MLDKSRPILQRITSNYAQKLITGINYKLSKGAFDISDLGLYHHQP